MRIKPLHGSSHSKTPMLQQQPIANFTCCAAGLPPNTSRILCRDRFQSCYWTFSAQASYSISKANCASLGGYPAVPNTYDEQLLYET